MLQLVKVELITLLIYYITWIILVISNITY